MSSWRSLLGKGSAVVLGLPSTFDLAKSLKSAREIRLATAFAHRSGWKHLKDGISGNSKVFLLTGLDCFPTEPELLREWYELSFANSRRVSVTIASTKRFFHPKVLIVNNDRSASGFAVVGSGNLSHGGLRTNTECSLYTCDRATIAELVAWFDQEFASGLPLRPRMIASYARAYEKNKARRAVLELNQERVGKEMRSIGAASLKSWERLVRSARQYFSSGRFQKSYAGREAGAKEILAALRAPRFDFDRAGWNRFYSVGALGRLDQRHRDKLFEQRARVRNAFRSLLKGDERSLASVIDSGGQRHVDGLGLNTATKVLAAYDPTAWPVFNSRVASTLLDFGYTPPRGVGETGRYLAYRNLMAKFMGACHVKGVTMDAFALDSFFYHWSWRLQPKRGGSIRTP